MRVGVLHEPEPSRLAAKLNELVKSRALIMLLGRCSVFYEGRSASKLGEGDRLVIVKPDGAVLVHRPTGYSPVNWQPDSKVIVFEVEQGRLTLRSIRERPREILEVRFTTPPIVVYAESMEDKAEFVMYMDEHEIRDFLAQHPEVIEPGLRVITVEKPVEPGFIDLYAIDSKGRIVVVEIKRVTAGKDAVTQLARYVEALRKRNRSAPIRGILIAPSITRQALELLNSLGLEYRQISIEKIYAMARKEKRSEQTRDLLSFLSLKGGGGSSRDHSG